MKRFWMILALVVASAVAAGCVHRDSGGPYYDDRGPYGGPDHNGSWSRGDNDDRRYDRGKDRPDRGEHERQHPLRGERRDAPSHRDRDRDSDSEERPGSFRGSGGHGGGGGGGGGAGGVGVSRDSGGR